MGISRVIWLEVTTLIHATDNEEKVMNAVLSIMPKVVTSKMHIRTRSLEGHYGNPIRLFKATIKSNECLELVLINMIRNLNEFDKIALLDRLPLYLTDKNTLYLRVDKQAAIKGIVSITENDPIRFKIKFKTTSRKKDVLLHEIERMLKDEKVR